MNKVIFILLSAAMICGGAYIQFVHSNVSQADQALCESAYRQQFSTQPDVLEQFLPQCRHAATLVAMKAAEEGLAAQDVALQVSNANRSELIKTLIAFGLIGGGIGVLGAAFKRKKPVST